jgi:nitrite reductase/ring-hydroxylating ferredoxin subunit
VTLKLAIERAIEEAAPDVISIEAEGAAAPAPPPGLIQLEMAPPVRGGAPAARAWATAGPLGDLDRGGAVLENVEGEAVLFLRLGGRPYAYRPGCPACGQSLAGGALADAELACPECGARYDVRHAGRGIDAPALHLEPVPLLVEGDGRVKVALGSAA